MLPDSDSASYADRFAAYKTAGLLKPPVWRPLLQQIRLFASRVVLRYRNDLPFFNEFGEATTEYVVKLAGAHDHSYHVLPPSFVCVCFYIYKRNRLRNKAVAVVLERLRERRVMILIPFRIKQ